MTEVADQPVPAFGAFERQLSTLCIKEFPCGLGPWREPDAKLVKPKKKVLRSISGRVHRPPQPDLNLSKALLSLDLSNNNLTDLLDIIRKLSTLPKLRNLILLGNPLSLIPGYRGYTIDSLRKLSILDDIRISADEKHHFKGLARRREYILDEAKVALEVTYLKGVPLPDEVKYPEEQPEYPVIERNYYVQFMFPADTSAHSSHLHNITQDDFEELGTIPDAEHHDLASDVQSARLEGSQQSGSHTEKNVIFSNQPEMKMMDSLTLPLIEETEEPPRSASAMGSRPDEGHEVKGKDGMAELPTETKSKIPLAPITSVGKPWAEEIELDWKVDVTRFDLTGLRDFFKQGMDFSVIEEMVLCYPVEEEENMETPTGSKKSKDGSKDKKDAKGKAVPNEKAKKKKKGDPEQEFRREPPQVTTLATFHIPLAEFLEGEYEFTSVFTQGGVEIAPSTVRSAGSAEHIRKKKKSAKDKKDSKDKKKREQSPRGKGKDDKKDGKGGKEDKKGKKGAAPPAPEDGDETPPPPPPLEVQVGVRLHHWTTAMDSLKEEEKGQNVQ